MLIILRPYFSFFFINKDFSKKLVNFDLDIYLLQVEIWKSNFNFVDIKNNFYCMFLSCQIQAFE